MINENTEYLDFVTSFSDLAFVMSKIVETVFVIIYLQTFQVR